MAVTIRNRTSRPIYVALHSGDTLRISPGGVSGSVNEVEVKGNATVEKLLRQRTISVESLESGSDGSSTGAVDADSSATDDSEVRTRSRKRA